VYHRPNPIAEPVPSKDSRDFDSEETEEEKESRRLKAVFEKEMEEMELQEELEVDGTEDEHGCSLRKL
jgi:hypothetical protein